MDKLWRTIEGYSEDSIAIWAQSFHAALFHPYLVDDTDMPTLKAVHMEFPETDEIDTIPAKKALGLRYSATGEDISIVQYFDIRDAERAWKNPAGHCEKLSRKQVEYVVAPSFITKGSPLPIWWFQTYRSRLIGQWWQRQGLQVIPTVEWGNPDTFSIAFRGLPEHSVLAVAVNGWNSEMFLQDFQDGIDYIAEHLHPTGLLLFVSDSDRNCGGDLDENLILEQVDFRTIPCKICKIGSRNVTIDDAQQTSWSMRLNNDLFNPWQTDDWDMPIMQPSEIEHKAMINMCGFNQALSSKGSMTEKICHFYIEDYQFERCWTNMDMYVPVLSKFGAILTPDFSLYENFPLPLWWFQTYRNRLLGQHWQERGLKVIPCVNWGGPETYDIVFRGLPEESVLSFSTIGWESAGKEVYQAGIDYMVNHLSPKQFLVYGRPLPWADYHGVEVIQAQNDNLASAKQRYEIIRLQRKKAEELKYGRQLSLFEV